LIQDGKRRKCQRSLSASGLQAPVDLLDAARQRVPAPFS
jgi:hypothetical protein